MNPPVSLNRLSSAIARPSSARSNESATRNKPGDTLRPAPKPAIRHSHPTDCASTGEYARASAAATPMQTSPAAPLTATHLVVTSLPNT